MMFLTVFVALGIHDFLSGDAVSSNEFVRCCGVEDPPMTPHKDLFANVIIFTICNSV